MDKHLDYEYLNSCRIISGLTNKAIALASNSSEATISRFFRGEMKDPAAALLCAVCLTIGASVDRAYGIIKPIDTAMTDPAPSIPAVVADVVQAIPPLVDPQEVADKVAQAVTESPLVQDPIDPHKLAQEIAAALPKPERVECESCRSARAYEATIVFQTKLIAVLGGGLGLMIVFMMILLLKK